MFSGGHISEHMHLLPCWVVDSYSCTVGFIMHITQKNQLTLCVVFIVFIISSKTFISWWYVIAVSLELQAKKFKVKVRFVKIEKTLRGIELTMLWLQWPCFLNMKGSILKCGLHWPRTSRDVEKSEWGEKHFTVSLKRTEA